MSILVSDGDRQLVELLRETPRTVNELIEELGVSANAVRQRLNRLTSTGILTRQKKTEGRGRPYHEYRLTEEGHRTAGNNFPDLARALWEEIQAIEDPCTRRALMAGAVQRMANSYQAVVNGETLAERLQSVEKFFRDRKIPFAIETSGTLPVLKVFECPYPDIDDVDHDFCQIEKDLFERVLGGPVDHHRCQTDGGSCCTFQASSPTQNEDTYNI